MAKFENLTRASVAPKENSLYVRAQRAFRFIVHAPISAYAGIMLLQLKSIWGIWWYKDLTGGDTSSYFLSASSWLREGRTSFLWSPLYTSFYGSLLHFSEDSYVVTILHRIIIVLLLAALILALMRQLMPPGIAWMAAAWWVVLPIDFNSLYEIHLFVLIPVVLAILAPMWIPGPLGRGAGSALFFLAGVLIRQEFLVAAVLFAIIGFAWDLRQTTRGNVAFRSLLVGYGVPLVLASLLVSFYYLHSFSSNLAKEFQTKNAFNVCQIFAFVYKQRATDFRGSPWSDCQPLMQKFFGSSSVTILEALRRNPQAMMGHFLWNLRVAPAGLQVALFNLRSGTVNPDYSSTYSSEWVWIPSIIICGVIAGGLVQLVRQQHLLNARLSPSRIWGWTALGCTVAGVLNVILTAVPRPSYLFIFAIVIRAATGFCFAVLMADRHRLRRWTVGASLVLVTAVVLAPSIYQYAPSPRPLLQAYRRLTPFRDLFAAKGATLVSTEFGDELSSYVGYCGCPSIRFDQIREKALVRGSFGEALNAGGATMFLADERTINDPAIHSFLATYSQDGWQKLDGVRSPSVNWALFARKSPAPRTTP
jgi:hypothetical protein